LQRKEKHILKILDKEFNIKLKSVFWIYEFIPLL
jgi:hypothetical protein